MMSNLIILDSGHNEYVGGKEAPDKSMREWEFNNDMQYKIKEQLEYLGFDVYLTNPNPSKKNEIGLSTRASMANNYWASKGKPNAMFISLHANAYGVWTTANGCETFHAKNASNKSKNFAKIVNDEIHAVLKSLKGNSVNRGVKSENFTVIYKTNMPSVLIEYAFYTNKEDLVILKNNRQELADATVKAICKYFNVAYKKKEEKPKEEKPKEEVNPNVIYRVISGSYSKKANAQKQVDDLKAKGFSSFLNAKTVNGMVYYRVIVGSYSLRSNAQEQIDKLKEKGFNAFIEIYNK